MQSYLNARAARKYADRLPSAWTHGSLGLPADAWFKGLDADYNRQLCKDIAPVILAAMTECRVLTWTPETWNIMRDFTIVYEGSSIGDPSTLIDFPELWIVPVNPNHKHTAKTGILWIPALDTTSGKAGIMVTWLVSHRDNPYRPTTVIPIGTIWEGMKVGSHELGICPRHAPEGILLAARAFMSSKAVRIDAHIIHSTAKIKKRKRQKIAARSCSVVYLRQFEELERLHMESTGVKRKPPRAHWVGLPGGFPRRLHTGKVRWISPFVRGSGGEPSALQPVTIVNR